MDTTGLDVDKYGKVSLLAEHDAEDGEDPEAGTATEKWLFPTLFRVAQQKDGSKYDVARYAHIVASC
jgi:hypothetical protein